MQLTSGQLLKATRLSKETFRHWRQVLPVVQNRKGHSPAFSPGDAVALSVLRVLTNDWGMQIGRLSQVSNEIFRLCNSTSWVALEGETLVVDVASNSCKFASSAVEIIFETPIFLCPLKSVMQPLREEFLRTGPSILQTELRLPPTMVDEKRAGGSRR